MKVTRTKDSLKVTQTKVIDNLLRVNGMHECKPMETPIEVAKNDETENILTEVPYRMFIDSNKRRYHICSTINKQRKPTVRPSKLENNS